MATFYLIRHAVNGWLGHGLAGRTPGVHLNAEGRLQAEQLAARLGGASIRHLFSSPLERSRETAKPLANRLGLPVQISARLNEVDFGDWSGLTFAALQPLEKWKHWNQFRSGARAPNGELMVQVQARMVEEISFRFSEFPQDHIALVSHADPIRAVLAHYLGMSLDLLQRLEVSPASVSILELEPWGARVLTLNQT